MTREENIQYARNTRQAAIIATENITYWIERLQVSHDRTKSEMRHEDEYQLGYLHGLTHAIEYMKDQLPAIREHDMFVAEILEEIGDDE